MKNILKVGVLSGFASGLITFLLFWCVLPSAWLFFIIPALMGWSIDKFVTFPKEDLLDDESYNRISKQTGLLCGGLVLIFVFLTILPMLVLLPSADLLLNAMFFVVCAVSVYWGYRRGLQCVTDAYYDASAE